MTLHIEPEKGVAKDDFQMPEELAAKTAAAAETAHLLSEHGLNVKPTTGDMDTAAKLAMSVAENPVQTNKAATAKRVGKLTPATLLLTDKILKDFGHRVVDNAEQLRHLVTNKLIEETDNPDARIRIRALELLGKIADVGLFAERTEVTVTHKTTDELKESLREKLTRLANPDVIDAEVVEYVDESGQKVDRNGNKRDGLDDIDVDAVLGLDDL